jgi:hypothetical protein
MICYIYFVKCPNCDDQPFDFFDDAKSYAMGCLQNKPIITQVELCRNDFGECTDHCDLGQVWSWENEAAVEDEVVPSVFTKGHLATSDNDPEFAALDNSLDVDKVETDFNTSSKLDNVPDNFRRRVVESVDSIATNKRGDYLIPASSGHGYSVYNTFDVLKGHITADDDATAISRFELGDLDEGFERKPIPEGMTIEQLVEEMEENEDTVECKVCGELRDKSDCSYDGDYRGWVCSGCETTVEQHLDDPHPTDNYTDDARGYLYDSQLACADELARLLNSGKISTPEEVLAVMQKFK